MNILITGGSTNVMIDQVRCISNIFRGRTADEIAEYYARQFMATSEDHEVVLITSSNHFGEEKDFRVAHLGLVLRVIRYKTYDELLSKMSDLIQLEQWDVIIHSAAVSDYKVEGTYTMAPATVSTPSGITAWSVNKINSSTKIDSKHESLYLKLIPTEKIVDKIREWGFKGKLVKFKLQVGISDVELIEIAKNSRKTSDADYIVANTLETAKEKAFIIDKNDNVSKIDRKNLSRELFEILNIKKE